MKQFKYHKPCAHCEGVIYITDNDSPPKTVDDKPVCDKCYYDELGAEIEQHPIGVFIRRGG